jgi:diguanylate cyclase (GGDEF)-like protein
MHYPDASQQSNLMAKKRRHDTAAAAASAQPQLPLAALDAHTKQLEILNEIARIATADLDLRPMLQRITDTLASRLNSEFVACVTVDVERKAFVCEAVTSAIATVIFPGYSRPLGSGVVGEVAAKETPILIDDVRTHPNYIETLPGALSELCVPIRHGRQLVAILNLESTRLAAFRDQLPLVLMLAEQVAGAIASARDHEELKQRARLMQMMSEISRKALESTELDELLARVVSYIHDQLPIQIVVIVLYDAEKKEYEEAAYAGSLKITKGSRWPLSHGVLGRCITTAKPQLVLDVADDPDYVAVNPKVSAELAVPICFQNRILGVLNLESESADVFTPANVLAFEAFADQVAGAIHLAAVTRDLEEANERLHRLSMLDPLTGVANRRRFDELLDIEWRRGVRSRNPLSLLMIDVDKFKPYNDAKGHQAGDECLRLVASILRENLHRAADVVSRYGGEEFAVLLPDSDGEAARRTAERLRERVAERAPVTISVGVATAVPYRDLAPGPLIGSADEALYEAKRAGRNRVVVH